MYVGIFQGSILICGIELFAK